MVSNQIILKTIMDLHTITKVHFCVVDREDNPVASTFDNMDISSEIVDQFASSFADSQEIRGYHFFKIMDEDVPEYILIVQNTSEDAYTMGRIAVAQIQSLIVAYKEHVDKNTFIQNVILDNMLLVDVYNRARKLHIESDVNRVVVIVEAKNEKESSMMEVMKELFGSGNDFVTEVDEKSIILVKEVEKADDDEAVNNLALMICDMMNTEAMLDVRVSYGTIIHDLQNISRSYKEARMALNVGKIFYNEKKVQGYPNLGIGRLIYQLPLNLCKMFIKETFTENLPDTLDEETLITINGLLENSLNVSETARQLFIHRNTLVYRLEKLQKSMGLDIRNFDDAMTFKIALMVLNYMKYMEEKGLE